MGVLLRLFLFLCLLYLVVRLVKSWWQEGDKRVQGEPKQQVRGPFDGAEILDAKFTEVPPDEVKENGNSTDSGREPKPLPE
jgi:hypothetical protein